MKNKILSLLAVLAVFGLTATAAEAQPIHSQQIHNGNGFHPGPGHYHHFHNGNNGWYNGPGLVLQFNF